MQRAGERGFDGSNPWSGGSKISFSALFFFTHFLNLYIHIPRRDMTATANISCKCRYNCCRTKKDNKKVSLALRKAV